MMGPVPRLQVLHLPQLPWGPEGSLWDGDHKVADGRGAESHSFGIPLSPESCPPAGVVPHPFHQLGKSRRPGKR